MPPEKSEPAKKWKRAQKQQPAKGKPEPPASDKGEGAKKDARPAQKAGNLKGKQPEKTGDPEKRDDAEKKSWRPAHKEGVGKKADSEKRKDAEPPAAKQ